MSIDIDRLVQNATGDFQDSLANTRSLHADLLAALTSEVEAVGLDKLDDYFMDAIDEARGHIASSVANGIEEPGAQEDAISQIEKWFSDNISDQGAEIAVLCAIWGYGPEQGAGDIRREIASIPGGSPTSTPGM